MTRRKWGRVLQVLGLPIYLIYVWGYVAESVQGEQEDFLLPIFVLLFSPCLIIGFACMPLRFWGDRIIKEEDERNEFPALPLPTTHPYR